MDPHILCFGLPGSGKSTSAKRLVETLPRYILHHRTDMYEQLGISPFNKTAYTPDEEKKINAYFRPILKELLDGKNLLTDAIGATQSIREWPYQMATNYNKELLAIWHDLPSEIAHERIQNRPDRHIISERDFMHNDPLLRDKFESKWSNPLQDLDNPAYSHVSMIKYNTHTQKIERVRVSLTLNNFVDKVEEILLSSQ